MKWGGLRASLLPVRYFVGAALFYVLLLMMLGGLFGWLEATEWAEASARYERAKMQGLYRLIEQRYLVTPRQDWEALTKAMKSDFAYPFRLIDHEQARKELPDAEHASLAEGLIVLDAERVNSYKAISGTPMVVALNPYAMSVYGEDESNALLEEIAPWLIIAMGLALPFYVLVYRLWRDIHLLYGVASRLGAGDLSTRADKLSNRLIVPLGHIFNRMADDIQRLLEAQHLLAQAVVHEIRTPLARMRFGLDLMDGAGDAASRNSYRASIEADIDSLDRLAEDSLAYARVDRCGSVNRGYVDARRFIDTCRAELASGGKATVTFADPDIAGFRADAELVKLALRNLIGNARRYASDRIEVSLCRVDEAILFVVEDDGPGVPAGLRGRIYEPFVQVRNGGGNCGLGLALVRVVAEKHGGWCDVGDSKLGGALFRLALSA